MRYFGVKRVFLLLFLFLALHLHAQMHLQLHKSRNEKSWFVDGCAGFSMYYGSLGFYNYDPIEKLKKESHYSLGINLGKSLNYITSVRAYYNFTGLKAYNIERKIRLDSKMHNFGGQFLINISSWIGGISYVPDFTIYGIAGAGVALTKPSLYYLSTDTTDLAHNTLLKSGSAMAFEINAGMGISYQVFHRFDALLELAYHFSFSDELDISADGGKDKILYLKAGIRYRFGFPGIKSTKAFGRNRK